MPKIEGFENDYYHKRYEVSFGKNPLWSVYIQRVYRSSEEIIRKQGWNYSLQNVLLCGTGNSTTTKLFVKFIKEHNKLAKITIMDKAKYPLDVSRRYLEEIYGKNLNKENIFITQQDALKTSFPNNSFDLIETDFLLEFFTHERKLILLKEWNRLLKTEGVITTRDWIEPKSGLLEKFLSQRIYYSIKKGLGVEIYKTVKEEYIELFKKAGFEVNIKPFKIPFIGLRIPLAHFITAKKL